MNTKKKSFSITKLLGKILVAIGILIFLYPLCANLIKAQQTVNIVQKYESSLNHQSKSDIDKKLLDAEDYNNYIFSMSEHNAYDGNIPKYNKTLNNGNRGMMGYVSIPQISISNLPIYHGDDQKTLELGVGHIEQTSLPIGGENSHSVLSAHSGRANNTLFSNLDKLKKGDVFYVNVLNKKMKYKINDIRIVKPKDVSSLSVKKGEDLVTLLTCYPTGINTHRLLVTGTRIPYNEKVPQEKQARNKFGYNFWVILVGSLLVIIAIIYIIVIFLKKLKDRRKK